MKTIPPTMVTASDITRGKPDPQPYLAGAVALGFDPRTCLVFEDAPSGIRAAHAAGATVIGITYWVLITSAARDPLFPFVSFSACGVGLVELGLNGVALRVR
jgi:beta-phosphoglucomutase-like phosphatase (HAD superfamily)